MTFNAIATRTGRNSRSLPRQSLLWTIAACATSALPAQAESVSVTLRGSYIETVQSGGVTVPRADLRAGVSAGPILAHAWGTTIRSADGRNLESYFIRNNTGGAWNVDLGSFSPSAGPAADFFLFEVGGNDTVQVQARFPNGSLGAPINVTGWTPTSMTVDGGPNKGERPYGLAFRFEDLKHANGTALSSNDSISGIRIIADDIDAASFLVRETGYHGGSNGDGSHTITPANPSMAAPMEITFLGPWQSETGEGPNPFLDYRLTVTFDGPDGRQYRVAGFFDADGGEGDVGNLWKVRFNPPVFGNWTATASFRVGAGVALDLNPNAGAPTSQINGKIIHFNVGGVPGNERGFYRVGKLQDAGRHYRKFEHGGYYLKAGTNGPENFLAIRACDDVTKSNGPGVIHSYEPHRPDWNEGDPILDPLGGIHDGKGVIGALNYLSEQGVNSLFMMMMNLGGDGNDVYPFLGPRRRSFEKLHYDTSRLRQWNTIFEHAQRQGISLSFVLNETEADNETWLDNGNLGVERRLFYRELIARFGHHPAIRWNLCEENDFSLNTLNQFAAYITALDAYDSIISVHNNPNDIAMFQALASNPDIDAASLQFDPNQADSQVEQVRAFTAQTGRPWTVDADEQGPWQIGLTDTNAVDTRKRILYDSLFSGGGVEFYFGYHDLPLGGDLSVENFATREEMWTAVKHARTFMEGNLPFWDMTPDDDLVRHENGSFGGAEVFAKEGETYAIYFPNASTTGQIDLASNTSQFFIEWFDPRTGTFESERSPLGIGGGWKDLGSPPYDSGNDWVALVQKQEPIFARTFEGSVAEGTVQTVEVRLGTSFANRNYFLLSSLSTTGGGFLLGGTHVPIDFDRWTRVGLTDSTGQVFENQVGQLSAEGSADVLVKLTGMFTGGLIGQTMYHSLVLTQPYDYASHVLPFTILP